MLTAGSVFASANPPLLSSNTNTATAGYYQLSWKQAGVLPAGAEYELQVSADPGFAVSRVQYRGPDGASVVSGQGDGVRHYRVRIVQPSGETGAWSKAVSVTVQHHPLARALWFFLAGTIVFVATLTVILRGARQGVPGTG